jgi:SAM-dependent methyltransferase
MTSEGGYEGVEGTRPYAGTAEYYARYRPRVSDAFLNQLREVLMWTPSSRVLDLGTGPGHLALRVAPLVGEVVGVDPESDMLDAANRIAAEERIANVRFVLGSSEDLTSLGVGTFQSVTMSASFHWMLDKDRVMADLAAMTSTGDGSVAFVTTGVIDRAQSSRLLPRSSNASSTNTWPVRPADRTREDATTRSKTSSVAPPSDRSAASRPSMRHRRTSRRTHCSASTTRFPTCSPGWDHDERASKSKPPKPSPSSARHPPPPSDTETAP